MERVSTSWRTCAERMGRYEKSNGGEHHKLRQYASLDCMVEQSAMQDRSEVSLIDIGAAVGDIYVFGPAPRGGACATPVTESGILWRPATRRRRPDGGDDCGTMGGAGFTGRAEAGRL